MSIAADGSDAVLLVVGLSRETAPVDIRERASLDATAARRLLRELRSSRAADEAVALSTCNRTEVYAVVSGERAAHAPTVIRETLCGHTVISREELVQLGYVRFEREAAEHLFGVVAGLNSTILGEPEIVAQARGAVGLAREERALGTLLEGLFNHAMAAGRRVRANTAVARGSTSVSAVAVDLARALVDDLETKRALVIGAGRVASAVIQRLACAGIGQITVANRSAPGEAMVSGGPRVRAVTLDALADQLALADLVVCATAAPAAIVSRRALAAATRGRQQALVVLDLAVPRDVEPTARELAGVVLRDIDEIQRIAAANLHERRRELPRAWSIVRSEAVRFATWRAELAADALLAEVRRRAEEIRVGELERALARAPAADQAELARLNAVTRSLVNKLLHDPTSRIRRAGATATGRAQLEVVGELFGLSVSDRDAELPPCPRISVVIEPELDDEAGRAAGRDLDADKHAA